MAKPERPEGDQTGSSLGGAASFGLQFAVAILVFLYLGRWVDARLGTSPTFLLIGVFLGAGGAFFNMYRKVSQSDGPGAKGKKP
jgi:F0F1-type ATP synthase assembly protein I